MIAALVANAGINILTIYFLQQRPAERAPIVQRLVAIAIGAISVAIGLVLISSPIVFGFVLNRTDWPLLLAAAAMGSTMIAFEFSGALMLGLGSRGDSRSSSSSADGAHCSRSAFCSSVHFERTPASCWAWPSGMLPRL